MSARAVSTRPAYTGICWFSEDSHACAGEDAVVRAAACEISRDAVARSLSYRCRTAFGSAPASRKPVAAVVSASASERWMSAAAWLSG